MTPVTSAAVSSASNANPGSVQGQAAVSVLKTSLHQQASAVGKLLESLPEPVLMTSGSVGTQLNAYA